MFARAVQGWLKQTMRYHRFYSVVSEINPAAPLQIEDRGIYESVFPDNCVSELRSLLSQPIQCVYAGFDPTAESLHIGNLFVITTLLRWQRQGHRVIALIGNATGQIGDPSHRRDERDEITTDLLLQNSQGIKRNLETIFENHKNFLCNEETRSNLQDLIIVDNLDWYKDLKMLEFIKNIGKYFRMGTMLGRTSVQSRLNSQSGMSFTEFTYAVFQAYDWLQLCQKYNCRFQIGGSDQMGNIMSGYDLITRYLPKSNVYGLTLPLITTDGGRKFSKSSGNAVWLAAEKSSSYQLYQFFVRTTDADVGRFLRYFTFLEIEEIEDIIRRHNEKPEMRDAQRILAEQVTLMVHGEAGLHTAQKVSESLFSLSTSVLASLEPFEIAIAFEGARTIELPFSAANTVFDLAMAAKCFQSEHDARRIIKAGGFYINNKRMNALNQSLVRGEHILKNSLTVIRTGKKTYHIVKWRD